jgi:hypothetical protein
MTGYKIFDITVTVAIPRDDSRETPITAIDLVDFGDECFILGMSETELALTPRWSLYLDAESVKKRKQPRTRRKKHAQGH